jgi:hypothetical protein
MDVFLEALRSGSIPAWAGLLVAVIVVIKLLFKMSKWLVLFGILVALGYGFVAFFPELAEPVLDWLQSNTPETAPIE